MINARHALRARHAAALSMLLVALAAPAARAETRLPALFTDHMVLQQNAPLPVWGWAEPEQQVTVRFDGQEKQTTADADGRWQVTLDPIAAPAGGDLVVIAEGETRVRDVAVGEVWVCSGQSNMEWPVAASFNARLDIASGDQPDIRLITVRNVGTQTRDADFPGAWERATPEAVAQFSAVGYLFGRRLQQVLDVPVGLIDNAWGGSAAEAWVPRERLEGEELYAPLLQRWAAQEEELDEDQARAEFDENLERWRRQANRAKAAGQRPPERPVSGHPLLGNHRPGNLFNARNAPLIPYAIRGVIWYQGESNAGRAAQYGELFPLMIQSWRDEWDQGPFSFYWVQLADFMREATGPEESEWAELREAQTQTLDRLENTGQAVIIDIGDAADIHPRNKQEVANRLARLALAKDYGVDLPSESPRCESIAVADGKVTVEFNAVGGGLKTWDGPDVQGFTIAGQDRQWRPAQAKIVDRDTVEVWSDEVAEPVAVRYAWANNPVCNLYTVEGLPVTPFRTDTWPGVTDDRR